MSNMQNPGGYFFERERETPRRKDRDDFFPGKELSNCANWTDQIAIGRNEKGNIEAVSKGVFHQFDRDINVSHLFVMRCIGMPALTTGNRIGEKVTVEKREARERLQGLQKRLLPEPFIIWIFYNCREILGFNKRLIYPEILFSESLQVEPVETFPAFITHAKVQVIAVYICNDSIHDALSY